MPSLSAPIGCGQRSSRFTFFVKGNVTSSMSEPVKIPEALETDIPEDEYEIRQFQREKTLRDRHKLVTAMGLKKQLGSTTKVNPLYPSSS